MSQQVIVFACKSNVTALLWVEVANVMCNAFPLLSVDTRQPCWIASLGLTKLIWFYELQFRLEWEFLIMYWELVKSHLGVM